MKLGFEVSFIESGRDCKEVVYIDESQERQLYNIIESKGINLCYVTSVVYIGNFK